MESTAQRRHSFIHRLLAGIAVTLPLAALAGEMPHPEDHEQASGMASKPARSLRISSSVVVDYTDLDVNVPADAQTLYARLKSAARKACGHQPPPVSLRDQKDYQGCYNQALGKAVKQVDSRQLYALHAEARKTTVS